ncbi:MAG: triose-phosphate isomerase [Salibacteraceae bacterium]
MAKNIVLGNWKMNLNLHQAQQLLDDLNLEKKNLNANVQIGAATPAPYLQIAFDSLSEASIWVGSQNIHHEKNGAYTGEISAEMVKSLSCNFTLIGHSERRQYFHETNEQLRLKVDQALSNDLVAVFCCGETFEERKSGVYLNVIRTQLEEGLLHLNQDDFSKVIVAYEPVWAIGTGETASAEQAQEVHAFIRDLIGKSKNEETANATTLLYGGSCKPSNSKELFGMPDIDGGLIGGASLNAKDFIAIANSF